MHFLTQKMFKNKQKPKLLISFALLCVYCCIRQRCLAFNNNIFYRYNIMLLFKIYNKYLCRKIPPTF